MIIGHGDIASAIVDRPEFLYFAAGVSNSAETRESEYQREINLLMAQPRRTHLVYFSSLAVFYSDSRYANHKALMENYVEQEWGHYGEFEAAYTIIRLGNITWGRNPHTLINHLRARHAAGFPLEIQDTQRVVHTLDDFHWTLANVPSWSCEMHAPGRLLTVRQIVDRYVAPLGEFYRVA
jgi:nucleoside-diphosphate-sugar epimerase